MPFARNCKGGIWGGRCSSAKRWILSFSFWIDEQFTYFGPKILLLMCYNEI